MRIYLEKPIVRGDPSERFDRKQWKVMQQMMNDANKFVEILHSVHWEEGLPSDTIAGRLLHHLVHKHKNERMNERNSN